MSGMAIGTMNGSSSVSSSGPLRTDLEGNSIPIPMSSRMKPPEILSVEVSSPRKSNNGSPRNRKKSRMPRAMSVSLNRILRCSAPEYLDRTPLSIGKLPNGSKTKMRMTVAAKKSMNRF